MTGKITHRLTRGVGLSDKFDPATARTSSCTGKACFDSKAHALQVIASRRKRSKNPHNTHKAKRASFAWMAPFKCPHCGHWHISGSKGR